YLLGRGVERQPEQGVRWLAQAAAAGQPEAQQLLAELQRAAELARLSPQERFEKMREAAEQGDARAQARLALAYRTGGGVATAGNRWLERAVEQGDPDAEMYLGYSLVHGEGYRKDPVRGVELLRRAAERGHAGAQNYLAEAYRDGLGVAPDGAKAAEWYRKSA